MRDAAHFNWQVPKDGFGSYTTANAQLAVLMDIRAELEKLNAVFACSNFQGVPAVLRAIRANTSKPRYKQCPRCLANAWSLKKAECLSCGHKRKAVRR